MHYVILDMEWDGAYHKEHKRFVNQILQIGAVKLDEKFNIVDIFDVTVKSSISKKVSKRFVELTGITKEMMLDGILLSEAVDQYNKWLGNDTVTITWSNSDLYTIAENEKFLLNNQKFKIEKYLDLQKFIQNEMYLRGYTDKNQVSLSLAAEFLQIETEDIDFHTAKDDSLVAAYLLKKCYNEERFVPLIKDATNPEFFKRLRFKSYSISNIHNEKIDKKHLEFECPKCGKIAKRVAKWKYSNRWFAANFICDCGEKFNGRVMFRQTFDELIVKRKICEFKEKKQTIKEETKV